MIQLSVDTKVGVISAERFWIAKELGEEVPPGAF